MSLARELSSIKIEETKPNKICFLLEGCTTEKTRDDYRFPELAAALQLAKENKCDFFDSISSYDIEHISTQIKYKTENEQKALLSGIYFDFISEISSKDIIIHLLQEPYESLVKDDFYKEVPAWLKDLSPLTIGSFADDVFKTCFNNDIEAVKIYNKQRRNLSDKISDEISVRRFKSYIADKNISTIYALIGIQHLTMLDKIGTTMAAEDGYKHVRVVQNNKPIDVHLFGGTHGEMAHFEKLAKKVKEDGLSIPVTPATVPIQLPIHFSTLDLIKILQALKPKQPSYLTLDEDDDKPHPRISEPESNIKHAEAEEYLKKNSYFSP